MKKESYLTQWHIKDFKNLSFPSLKVNEPLKFQMSGFWVSTGESHSSKQAIFSHAKLTEKMRHI